MIPISIKDIGSTLSFHGIDSTHKGKNCRIKDERMFANLFVKITLVKLRKNSCEIWGN
jgi:hypothetical protein